MKQCLIFLPTVLIPAFFCLCFYTATNWATIINIMEEKTSFGNAIEAFKKGATIYRVDGYRKYGSEVRISNGKTRTIYGTLEKGEIECSMYFNEKDVMSDDWVIKWPDKGEQ